MSFNRFWQLLLNIIGAALLSLTIGRPVIAEVNIPAIEEPDIPLIPTDSPVLSIRPVGLDENGAFYVIYCHNGKKGASVANYSDPRQICASPPELCKERWDFLEAAEYACQ